MISLLSHVSSSTPTTPGFPNRQPKVEIHGNLEILPAPLSLRPSPTSPTSSPWGWLWAPSSSPITHRAPRAPALYDASAKLLSHPKCHSREDTEKHIPVAFLLLVVIPSSLPKASLLGCPPMHSHGGGVSPYLHLSPRGKVGHMLHREPSLTSCLLSASFSCISKAMLALPPFSIPEAYRVLPEAYRVLPEAGGEPHTGITVLELRTRRRGRAK